jgi:hypothetical protein
MKKKDPLPIIGWREWLSLPALGIDYVKAKVDTGARSSSLHAYDIEPFRRRGKDYIRFKVHPLQRSSREVFTAEAPLLEYRNIRSSTGHVSRRPVVVTTVALMETSWDIELTLTNRDEMGFRMLLGREAVRRRFCVDPGKSYYGGKPAAAKKGKTP